MEGVATSSAAVPAYPSAGQRVYIIAVIILAGSLGFLDRQIISLLIVPIRADLGISNAQVGLLYGFAFVLLFGTVGLPIGRLVDRRDRRRILACGIAMWSFSTVACGFAPNFGWLFAARVGVGLGEACLAPAACSILADCFTPQYRSRALFAYILGAFIGLGASMIAGGALFEALVRSRVTFLGLGSWRLVFVLIGAPGLLVALLLLLMHEPARRGGAIGTVSDGEHLLPYLRAHWRVFVPVYLAQSALAFASYGIHAWLASYLIRRFGLSVGVVGRTMGIMLGLGGFFGALASVQLCDRLTAAGARAAKFRVAAIGAAIAIPPLLCLPIVGSAGGAWMCLGLLVTASPFASSTGTIMMQELFPNRLRGQGTALMLFLISLLGTSAGPLTVGFLIDFMGDRPERIAPAMACAGLPAFLLVIMLWRTVGGHYEAVRLPIMLADGS